MGLAARPPTRVAIAAWAWGSYLGDEGMRNGIRVKTSSFQRYHLPVREERFTRDEVYLADEAFLTGTAAEVTPVRELDDRKVGSGTPGPVTKQLQERFFAIVRGREDRYRSWLTYV
jgi:branched-subunit amino acid aminotransferase/4-amino-4-deoxychorismate lyase